jgi:hypothetical protein
VQRIGDGLMGLGGRQPGIARVGKPLDAAHRPSRWPSPS